MSVFESLNSEKPSPISKAITHIGIPTTKNSEEFRTREYAPPEGGKSNLLQPPGKIP